MAYIKRISSEQEIPWTNDEGEKDVITKITWLDHNVRVLNLVNGECKKIGQSETSLNQIEADIICGLVACLLHCDLSHNDIIALTGYQGQHDIIKNRVAKWGVRVNKIDGF